MLTIDRSDIQGNILEGYTFPHVMHLFAEFEDPALGRLALSELGPLVTPATRWAENRPRYALNLGLSASGLRALGMTDAEQREHGFSEVFRKGMQARAKLLGDDPTQFDGLWREPERIHLWLWMYGATASELDELRARVVQLLHGRARLQESILRGAAIRNAAEESFEHFGFRDGLSGPAIAGSHTPARDGDGNLDADGKWRPIATGEFILGHADESGSVSLEEDSLCANGTFAVFRKLGQDVAGFRDYVKQQAERLRAANPSIDEAWLAARMVGRERDGTPLSRNPLARDRNSNNAFTFGEDPDGRVCPLGSHIRRGNPRDGHGFTGAFARHRIVRRSMPFGTPLAEGEPLTAATSERFGQRGLLFVALNADIERQFEFLQSQYMNDGAAARQGGDADPLVGSNRTEASDFVIPGDPAQKRTTLICPKVPRFVECLGGEYFFLPSLRALAALSLSRVDANPPVNGEGGSVISIQTQSTSTEAAQ